MGTLTALDNRIRQAKETVEAIKYYIFDDFSGINADSGVEYPVLIAKPPQSKFHDKILEYQVYDMDMFVLLPEKDDDNNKWTDNWDTCSDALRLVVKDILSDVPNYILIGDVNWQIGHRLYNAKLIGARAQFKLRVYYGC